MKSKERKDREIQIQFIMVQNNPTYIHFSLPLIPRLRYSNRTILGPSSTKALNILFYTWILKFQWTFTFSREYLTTTPPSITLSSTNRNEQ